MQSGQGFPTGPGDPNQPPAPPRTLEEIQRRTPQVAGKVTLHHYPGGTVITPLPFPGDPRYTLPFHPLGFKAAADGTNTNAILQPGWALVRHIELGTNVQLFEPLIGTTSMWSPSVPELQLAGAVSYNYLHCNTTTLGLPNSDWNIVSSATVKNTVHFVPPDPEGVGGTEGDYWFEIFRTNLNSTNSFNAVQLKWGGHFSWSAELWAGIHPSYTDGNGEARPYSDFDQAANRHRFRTHINGHGHNVAEDGTTIPHSFYGRNICNSAASGTGSIYTGNVSARAAEFVCISERVSNPQVRVTQAGNEEPVFVQGNNKDLTISFKDCDGNTAYTLSFIDGLVQQSGAVEIQLGDCTNGAPA